MGVVERNFNSVPFKRLSLRIQPQSKPTFVVIVTSGKILGPYRGGGLGSDGPGVVSQGLR